MEFVHANVCRRVIAEYIQGMKAEMETFTTNTYVTLLFVILSFVILEISASHIGVKPLEPFNLAEFLWYGNVTREIRSEYHVCHIIRVKSSNSRSDGGKKEFLFRMLVGKMP